MEFGILELLVLVGTVVSLVYYYLTSTHNFWASKKVQGPTPVPFFGNWADVMLNRLQIGQFSRKLYEEYPDLPFVGYYRGKEPILLVRDLDLLKHILIKDFNTFADRTLHSQDHLDVLNVHLFHIANPRWKFLRTKLTPTFTSGKLKKMFYIMKECSDHLEKKLEHMVQKNSRVECRDLAARYTIDIIGTCAFGIDMNALQGTENQFWNVANKAIFLNFYRRVVKLMREAYSDIYNFIRPDSFNKEDTDYFINLVRDTIEYRRKNNIERHDFIDTLKEFRNAEGSNNEFEWTDELLAAQAFVFFVAGFETSSSTISYALMELSSRPDLQQKARAEITKTLKKHNNEITYEAVQDMKYLQMIIQETLRKYPIIPEIERRSLQDFVIPDTDIHLPTGQKILIPIYGIHYDEKYYPKPNEFDPERFSDEAKLARHPMAFLGFGEGPRNCIGARFGMIQTKLGLLRILKNYTVRPVEGQEYVIDKSSGLFLVPVGGINLIFDKV